MRNGVTNLRDVKRELSQGLDDPAYAGALRAIRRCRIRKARTIALTGVPIERELTHQKHTASNLADVEVHPPRVIGEDSKSGDLPRHPLDLPSAVVVPDPQQHQQASGDLADGVAPDPDRGGPHSLDDRSHAVLTSRGTQWLRSRP